MLRESTPSLEPQEPLRLRSESVVWSTKEKSSLFLTIHAWLTGCLDEVALTLIRDITSKLVIVGKHSTDETPDAAAQRDLNVAQYLTQEKGVDPARIEMRKGGELNRGLDNILVPAGASFVPGDTNTFDSNSVKRQRQPYAKPPIRH
jgi:hypothetical protein